MKPISWKFLNTKSIPISVRIKNNTMWTVIGVIQFCRAFILSAMWHSIWGYSTTYPVSVGSVWLLSNLTLLEILDYEYTIHVCQWTHVSISAGYISGSGVAHTFLVSVTKKFPKVCRLHQSIPYQQYVTSNFSPVFHSFILF